MKNFDSFDLITSRRYSGRGGFVSRNLDCYGGFGGLENNQTQQTSNVRNEQATVQGGSGNSVAVAIGGDHNTGNLVVNNYNADAEIVSAAANGLSQLAAVGESNNAQIVETNALTLQSVLSQFGMIAENAAPQSSAAQAELLAGTSPEGATAPDSFFSWLSGNQIVDIAVVGGTILTLLVYLKTKGRST